MAWVDPSCAFMHGVPVPVPARNDALKHPRTSKCIAQGQLPILLPGMWWHVMVRYLLRYWIHAKRIHEALDLTWSDMIWHDYHDLIRYFYVATSSPTSRLIRNVARDQSRRIATYVMEEQHQGSQKFTRHTNVYSASCFITATYGIIATE